MKEIWKDINGYNGLYQISNKGNVRKVKYVGKNNNRKLSIKTMHPKPDNNGYLVISFVVNKDKKRFYVHKLVADAFMGNTLNMPQIRHKDGDRSNNCVDNLERYDAKYENAPLDERWLPIAGYEGLYEISTYGRVYSVPRHKNDGCILSDSKNSDGYLVVTLSKNGVRKTFRIHRLVAETFIENKHPNSHIEVNHIDGNKENNNITNLEWCDRASNVKHSYDSGLKNSINKHLSKENIPKKVLRNDGVLFSSISKAAKSSGTSAICVSNVCHGNRNTANGYKFIFINK